mmetsp:Transcript_8482/g.35434  ORF Transcript_8482/g.35434 Transcript_8482/m.35434 type:complete len:272 (+) Transcript_8482:2500-3315(+)
MTHALEPRRGRDARNTWGPRVFAQSPIPRRRPTRPFGDFRAFPHHTRPLGGRARAGVGRASPRDARYERGCRRRRAPRDVAFSARPPSCGDSFVGPKSWVSRVRADPEMHKGERLSRARGFPGAQSEKQVNTVPLSICVSSHAKALENGGFSVEKTTRQRRGNPKLFAVFFRVIRTQRKYYARDFLPRRPTIFYFFPFRARRYLNISTSALRRGGDYPRVACIYIQQPRQHSTGSITLRHNNEQTSIRPTRRRRGRQTIQQVTLSRARGAT